MASLIVIFQFLFEQFIVLVYLPAAKTDRIAKPNTFINAVFWLPNPLILAARKPCQICNKTNRFIFYHYPQETIVCYLVCITSIQWPQAVISNLHWLKLDELNLNLMNWRIFTNVFSTVNLEVEIIHCKFCKITDLVDYLTQTFSWLQMKYGLKFQLQSLITPCELFRW